MHPIWYDYIKRNVDLYFISGLAGIWPPWFETKPRWFRVAWHIYHNLTDLILYLITITNFIGAVLLTDIFDVFASLPPLIHGIQMSGRLIILQVRRWLSPTPSTTLTCGIFSVQKEDDRGLHQRTERTSSRGYQKPNRKVQNFSGNPCRGFQDEREIDQPRVLLLNNVQCCLLHPGMLEELHHPRRSSCHHCQLVPV